MRRRLRSVSSTCRLWMFDVLVCVGDRAFPVAAARLWNSLPSQVTASPSLSLRLLLSKITVRALYKIQMREKSESGIRKWEEMWLNVSHLFSLSYPAFWLFSHLYSVYSARAVTRHLWCYNRTLLHLTYFNIACALARCRHRALIGACVSALSERMDDVAASTEWETEWLSLDREQLVEFIRSSELTVKDEWDLWQVWSCYISQAWGNRHQTNNAVDNNSNNTLCLKKTRKLWNGITPNYNDRFWWNLMEIFKIL